MDDVDPTEREGLTQHPTPNSAGHYPTTPVQVAPCRIEADPGTRTIHSQERARLETMYNDLFFHGQPSTRNSLCRTAYQTDVCPSSNYVASSRRRMLGLAPTATVSHLSEQTPLLISSTPHNTSSKRDKLFRRARAWLANRVNYIQKPMLRASEQIRHPHASLMILYDSILRPDIMVEFPARESGYPKREGFKALIDYQSKYSCISRDIFDEYRGFMRHAIERTPFPCMTTLGQNGGNANAIGWVELRWACVHNKDVQNTSFEFPQKYLSSTFYIMEESRDYQFIIGRDIILACDLLGVKRFGLNAANEGWRGQLHPVTNNDSLAWAMQDERLRGQERELKGVNIMKEWNAERESYASQQAGLGDRQYWHTTWYNAFVRYPYTHPPPR